MKTEQEIARARAILAQRAQEPGLAPAQVALLAGMLNALVWVADGPASTTIERILSGEPMNAPPAQQRAAFDKLRKGV